MIDDIPNLRRVLTESTTVAVVGLSANWSRPSFFAAKYMQEHGFKVIPVNPRYEQILGETCYPSLAEIPHPVDMVDCFRKPEEIVPLAQQAVEIKAKVLWMQLGVINHEACAIAEAAGLDVVMDRCVKIEYARLFGGLNYCGVNTKVITGKRSLWVTR